MQIVELLQGSPEWLAHRSQHFNASDAPAMMGCSKYKTRPALIREAATGLGEEITADKQRVFDAGHSYEALARPLAEEIYGEDLYPVVAVEGKLSASFDGLTLMYDGAWEHKSLNDELRRMLPAEGVGDFEVGAALPLMYRVQMEQQAIISGCQRVLFTASKWQGDQLIEARHCWYQPDAELAAQIVAGWAQFEQDVCAYQPPEVADVVEAVGHSPNQLPALQSSVTGQLVLKSNIVEWEQAALAYIKGVRDHELKTDEDFANAAAAAEWCENSKTTLLGVRSNLMGATGDVNTAVATLDRIAAELDKTRIAFNNAIKARKEARKAELILASQAELREHIAALTKRVGVALAGTADFAAVTKGLKTFASMEAKLSAELARSKVEANRVADLIDANRKAMDAADAAGLFPDFSAVCTKAADDFSNLIVSRRAAAQARLDAERERIRAEEAQRLEREAAQRQAQEAKNTEGQGPQHVLKAEPETADATDRGAPANASPVGGPMGVRQPAAAGPALYRELPTLKLGDICDHLGFIVTSTLLEKLGFPCHPERAAKLYRKSDLPAICLAVATHATARSSVPLHGKAA